MDIENMTNAEIYKGCCHALVGVMGRLKPHMNDKERRAYDAAMRLLVTAYAREEEATKGGYQIREVIERSAPLSRWMRRLRRQRMDDPT